MIKIEKTKPVMVTGATGYVASWLVKKLLDEGLTVHAAVRDPNDKNKLAHLNKLVADSKGKIQYFKSDLLNKGSYAEAMEGCELIFHTASPFTANVKNPQKELIDPAKLGTKNVLEQANQTPSVKRIVLTSSCAAIYTDCIDLKKAPKGMFTERVWNTSASLDYQPYSYSKTVAEEEAWKINKQQSQWDLITINPCFIMGPALNAKMVTSESFNLLKQLGDGTFKAGIPNIGTGIVDVRDVAMAHYLAGFTPEANGRYIICGHNTNFLKMTQTLLPKYGNKYPIPKKALPKWLLLLIGPLINKAITRKFIRNNVNLEWKADNSKSKESLGLTYRPLQETMNDAFQVLIDHKII